MFHHPHKKQNTCLRRQVRYGGFTLIEMMVTITIIALLTTMLLAYSRMGQSIQNLRRAASQLVANIRRAESLSMLTFGEDNIAWGVQISQNGKGYSLIYETKDKDLQSKSDIALSPGIIISNVLGKTYLFIPPDPTATYIPAGATINSLQNIQDNEEIDLKLTNKDYPYYKIIISPTGMIYKEIVNH